MGRSCPLLVRHYTIGRMPWLPIDEQIAYLKKGLSELIREEDLRERLAEAGKSGRPLVVKVGFDPTAPTCTWATPFCCAR